MNRFLVSRIASLCLLASLAAFPLAGCGGDDNNDNDLLGIGAGATSVFAGRKVSTVALSGGRTGTLDFVVNAANQCTGTLTVTDAGAATRQAYSFTVGTFNISGSVNPQTGAFSLNGTVPGSGDFNVNGVLPSPTTGTGGSYTLTAGGETYSGNFAPVAIPSPGATLTATPTPAPSAGGASTFTVVSKSADCNVTESKLANLAVVNAKLATVPGSGIYIFSSTLNAGDTTFTLGWQRQNDADGFTPETKTVSADPQIGAFGDDFQTAIYTTLSMPAGVGVSFGGVTLPGAGFWTPRGGNIVIESVSGKTVVVRGENVRFIPTPAPTNNGTGEFTANFRVTYSNVDGL